MPKPLAVVALGAFVVVDAVLVGLVLRHVDREPPASDITTVAATPTPAPSAASAQRAFDFDARSAAAADLANDGTFVLATRGACGDDTARVWTAADPGADLVGRDPGLSTVLAVDAGTGGAITVVGTGEDCVPRQVGSTDGGATWTDDPAVTLWHPSPRDPRRVVSPDVGASDPGCLVTSLSQVGGDFARVTCVDGLVRGTGDGGREWVELGRLDNVRTAAFTTVNTGYALARFEGCAAQVFTTGDSGRSWEAGACLVGDPARAVAASDTALVGVVGDDPQVYVSADGGTEFGRS